MYPASLKSLCKKVVFNGFRNLKKEELEKAETRLFSNISSDDYNRVKEMTLFWEIRERKEKLKLKEKKMKYIIYLELLSREIEGLYWEIFHYMIYQGETSWEYYMDISVVEEEKEEKKYLKRNNFEVSEAFEEFLNKMNLNMTHALNIQATFELISNLYLEVYCPLDFNPEDSDSEDSEDFDPFCY